MRMEIFRWWKYMRQTHGTPRHYGKPANNCHAAKENATRVRQTRNGRRAHFYAEVLKRRYQRRCICHHHCPTRA